MSISVVRCTNKH